MIEVKANVNLKPKEIASIFWSLHSGEQAEFFEYLYTIAGEHKLMMQAFACRDDCKELSPEALAGMQSFSAGAFKYINMEEWGNK